MGDGLGRRTRVEMEAKAAGVTAVAMRKVARRGWLEAQEFGRSWLL